MKTHYQALFQPINIGKLQLKNRLIVPPIGTLFCGYDGHICDRLIEHHKVRAKGGWGLIIVEGVAIDIRGRGGVKQYGIWDDSFVPGYKRLVDAVHNNGAKIALQIMHAGRNTKPGRTEGQQPLAPSAIPDPIMRIMPEEMTKEHIEQVIEQFVEAARRSKEAGFDAVEIHGGHGYLVSGFMSGYANKRTDEYGGGFEGYLRFPMEIVRGIKKRLGEEYPLLFRISGDEAVPGGRTSNESAEMSKRLVEEGVDAIHVSAGVYETSFLTMASADMEQGFLIEDAAKVKSSVDVPIIAVGRIHDPQLANEVIQSKKADLVSIGRQSLADPDWPNKVAENRTDEIVGCISCNEGCLNIAWGANPITCVQNLSVGLEAEYESRPSGKSKTVLIAGGGPAGLEAARTAAEWGHQVILYEKDDALGGQIKIAALPPSKQILNEVVRSRVKSMEARNVEINVGKALTVDVVKQIAPDVLIIATGSKTFIPNITGIHLENVVTAREVLRGTPVGKKIVIIGGGIVGCETADWLSAQGKEVAILEMLKYVAGDVSPAARYFLMTRLKEKNVRIITSVTVNEITENSVKITKQDEQQTLEPLDNVIIAAGAEPLHNLYEEGKDLVPEVHLIGDARNPGKILQAVLQGARVGRSL